MSVTGSVVGASALLWMLSYSCYTVYNEHRSLAPKTLFDRGDTHRIPPGSGAGTAPAEHYRNMKDADS